MSGATPADCVLEDARIVGKVAHGGDWAIAFLIARNCESKGGGPRSTVTGVTDDRVSLRQFAEMAKLSTPTVSRWFSQWERAAEAGIVPHAVELAPGQDHVPDGFNSHREWLDALEEHDWRSFRPKRVEAKDLRTPTDAEMRQMAKAFKETEPKDLGTPRGPLWSDGKPGGGPQKKYTLEEMAELRNETFTLPKDLRIVESQLQKIKVRVLDEDIDVDTRSACRQLILDLRVQLDAIESMLLVAEEVEREPIVLMVVEEQASA